MKQGRSTKGMTRDEAVWVGAVKHIGCILCRRRGFIREEAGPLAEAHHLLSGGIRKGHMHTVGLCPWHHRGRLIVDGMSFEQHRRMLGPALSEGSKPFAAVWGTDASIYAEQQKLVARYLRERNVPWLN